MPEGVDLLVKGCVDPGVAVTHADSDDPTKQIQEPLVLLVPQPLHPPLGHIQRVSGNILKCLRKARGFQFLNISGTVIGCHRPVVGDQTGVKLVFPDVKHFVSRHPLEGLGLMVTVWQGDGRCHSRRRRCILPDQAGGDRTDSRDLNKMSRLDLPIYPLIV